MFYVATNYAMIAYRYNLIDRFGIETGCWICNFTGMIGLLGYWAIGWWVTCDKERVELRGGRESHIFKNE